MFALLVQNARTLTLRVAARGKYVECTKAARTLDGGDWREVGIVWAGRQGLHVEDARPGDQIPPATPENAGTRFPRGWASVATPSSN